MLDSAIVRYLSIILGTVLWDVGAILQKKAVGRLPSGKLPVSALLGSGGWMAGLLVTTFGWALFVFGLDRVPLSAARTITGGSYVILALFSTVFLRAPLAPREWASLAAVTCGIILLGLRESASPPLAALSTAKVLTGVAIVALVSVCVFFAPRLWKGSARSALVSLMAFATLSGLLGSVGDLLTKVFLFLVQGKGSPHLVPIILSGVGFVTFYLAGFYMLSRAYQKGTVVAGVVVSDFLGRVGALFLGALCLSEPLGGTGAAGLQRAAGFLLVLGGSLLLGRFSSTQREPQKPA